MISAIFGLLCTYAGAETPIFATAKSGRKDALYVAHSKPGAESIIERWDLEKRQKIAEVRVNAPIVNLLSSGKLIISTSRHDILVGPTDLSSPPIQVWHTSSDILRVAPFRSGMLVLVVNNANAAHPSAGQVYWFLRPDKLKPRLLSLRSIYNFWDIQSGDIDGDGRPVIALCTWSKTRYVHTYARRYFIYGMSDRGAYPRWRGSRLSKPYAEARLVKTGAGSDWKLLSVEQVNADKVCLMLYKWDDFGFFGIGRSTDLEHATLIRNEYGIPVARISSAHGEELVEAVIENNSLALRHICSLNPSENVVVGRFEGKKVYVLIVPSGGIESSTIHSLPLDNE